MKHAVVSLLLLGALACAAPTAVSPELLHDIYSFAAYSRAAYCSFNYDGSVGNAICSNETDTSPRSHALLAGSHTVLEFTDDDDVAGNVAVNPGARLVVVSFRGTARLWDLVRDVQLLRVPAEDICANCTVHDGFWTSFLDVREALDGALSRGPAARTDYRLVVTGHSYGGAVATIVAAHLRSRGRRCDLFTYGSPRVSNREFAEYASDPARGLTARVTNRRDVVTAQPPIKPPFGFAHVSPEYWFEAGIDKPAFPDNLRVCHGTQTYECSGQYTSFNPLKFWEIASRLSHHTHWYYSNWSTPCPSDYFRRSVADTAPTEEQVLQWVWETES